MEQKGKPDEADSPPFQLNQLAGTLGGKLGGDFPESLWACGQVESASERARIQGKGWKGKS